MAMKRIWQAALALSMAGSVLAADMPAPKVMSDAPASDGKWKMEMLEVPGASKADMAAAAGMGAMTVCATAAKAMAPNPKADKNTCKQRLVEDTSARAVMEINCPDAGTSSRITITRAAARSYDMSLQDLKKPDEKPTRMRMSYVGACSANEGVIGLDKDSPACKQMHAQLPEIEKARAGCAKAGANRASCEQLFDQQLAQLRSMCGGR
jgi:hypothetical protein